MVRGPVVRRRERRRLAVAVISTLLAIPLLLVEVAPGADASPDSELAAFVVDELAAIASPDRFDIGVARADSALRRPRSVSSVTGADLAAPRLVSTLSNGDALRAQAEAEAEEAARQAEAKRQRREAEQAEQEAAERAERRAEAERRAAEEAAERADAQARAEAEAEAESSTTSAGGPTAEQWHALRMCESSNNYQAVSGNGLYFGAYQFYPGTWDSTASHAGRSDLVGVRPDHAAPADQDAMAQALYQRRGSRPWPHCGVHLR
ncbi:MAG: transglycosylase family protein [Acidimicrobiales bacterium]